jgi:hypothetical protein
MANVRQVSSRLWNDGYVADLSTVEKLMFVYLITNEHVNIAGIYELPVPTMAAETGLERSDIEEILARFQQDGKVSRADKWLKVTNFPKYQAMTNPKIAAAVQKIIAGLPEGIIDRLSIPYGYPMDRLSHGNGNGNGNGNGASATPAQLSLGEDNKNITSITAAPLTDAERAVLEIVREATGKSGKLTAKATERLHQVAEDFEPEEVKWSVMKMLDDPWVREENPAITYFLNPELIEKQLAKRPKAWVRQDMRPIRKLGEGV